MRSARTMKCWILVTAWTMLLLATVANSKECTGVYTAYTVVDGSSSVGDSNFLTVKSALKDFTNESISGNNNVKIGIVVYDDNVTDVIPAESNITSLSIQIDAIEYLGGGTETHLGIEEATRLLQEDPSPHPKVIVVITDGVSSKPNETAEAASQASESGITMIAVGIDESVKDFEILKKKYVRELADIASSSDWIFQIGEFGGLASDVMQIVQQLCQSVVLISDGLSNLTVLEGNMAEFRTILSQANVTDGIWSKDGTDLTTDTRYVRNTTGNTQTLTIRAVEPSQSGEYTYTIGNSSTSGTLIVVAKESTAAMTSKESTLTTIAASLSTAVNEAATTTANTESTGETVNTASSTTVNATAAAATTANTKRTGGTANTSSSTAVNTTSEAAAAAATTTTANTESTGGTVNTSSSTAEAASTTRTPNTGGGADYVPVVAGVAAFVVLDILVAIVVAVILEGQKRGFWMRPKHPHTTKPQD